MLHPALLFAFDLVSPAMLGWLAAAAAPILIHLWSRRRYREMTWAAMEYLLRALQASRRRMRLEQWLLLLIRTLLVVLIVLAVAEPIMESAVFVSARGQRTHRVLVLDGSFSMAYRPGDKTRFDRAKEIAAQIVHESSQGDGFTLVLMSSPPRVVVGTPALDHRDFLKEIEQLELPHTTADLPKTLAEVEQVLAAARRDAPRLAHAEIYFLTDLGRVGWGTDRMDPATLAEFRKRSQRLAESARLAVIDLGQPDAENIAVTAARSSDPFAVIGRPMEVQAELKNFGRRPRSRVPVELLADGRRIAQEFVDLPAGGETSVAFAHRFEAPGDHVLEVRTEGDALDVDNHRWLAVPVKEHLRVLCVDGRPSADPFRSATGYLAAALAPGGTGPGSGLVRAEVVPESQLRELDLGRYDCVFLCDVPQFTAGEAGVLDAYLRSGGSLVIFLGQQVQADRYNRELGGETPGSTRLLPARLGGIVRDRPQTRLSPLDYRHPIVRSFQGQESAGLLSTPVFAWFQLTIPKDSQANRVLATAEGDPLIVEEAIHRGRVILVATAAGDTTWTALPVWPSFVPIVQEMLAYAAAGQLDERNLRVGEPLGGSFPARGLNSLAVQTPSGRTEEVRLRTDGDYQVWAYPETSSSGAYTVKLGQPLSRNEAFAVNVDPVESDLTTISPDELRDDVWPDVPFVHQTTFQNLDQPAAGPVAQRNELAKGLLYVVLALLLVETYLARRFGHHAQAKAEAAEATRKAA